MNRIHELKNRMFPTGIIRKKKGITGNPSRRRKRFCRRQPAFAPSTGAKGGGIDNSGEQEKSYIFYTKEESYLRIQATWYNEERERVYGR